MIALGSVPPPPARPPARRPVAPRAPGCLMQPRRAEQVLGAAGATVSVLKSFTDILD
jgi:hypothetical protein